ncbi:MAG: ABC transporter substrate-binding protein, partial [Desulfobacterales bacterium]
MSKLKELEEMLFKGKLNRREFIARVSALGLTAAMSPALLSTLAHASGPKKGGRLRIGCAGAQTSDSLDPITVSNLMTESLTWQLRNCLVEVDYKSNPIPELAESWEATPDAKKWIFKIRKGVEFHNGKTM